MEPPPNLDTFHFFDALCGHKECRAFVGPDKHEHIESPDDSHLTTRASVYVVEHALKPVLLRTLTAMPLRCGD
jgi:hypothetical protein